MKTITLPGVGTITTFDPVPKDFDPFTAKDDVLRRYGFPAGKWRNRWGRPKQVIQPTFRVMDYKHRSVPRERLTVDLSNILRKEWASDWSGAIVYAAAQDTINSVEGVWTIPNCRPPGGAVANICYTASSWVGIDHGEGSSPDILQMGVDSNATIEGGSVKHDIYPWSEWAPGNAAYVDNFPVSVGDEVNGLIVVDETSKTAATMYLKNETQGIATSFILTAPQNPPIQLVGDCAEWIVEALRIPPAPTWELGKYGVLYFDGAKAGTVNGATLLADSGDTIDMIDSNHNVISQGSTNSSTQVQCTYSGP